MTATDTSSYPIVNFEDYVRAHARSDTGWLAGYPRSGAALVRTILAHCFGQHTGTIYKEGGIGTFYAEHLRLVPSPIRNIDLDALIARQRLILFKTHEKPRPPETVPMVVIVRDGRRTLESLQAFYQEHHQRAYNMTQMIRGQHQWGSWSEWIRAWASSASSRALWLRYEDIMADVPGTVDRIALWFDLVPVSHEIPPFEELHEAHPAIFRRAEVDGNGGMTEQEEALFWELQGGVMSMLGYRR